MPIPSRSRSLRQPGFSREEAQPRTKNIPPSKSQVPCEYSLTSQAKGDDHQARGEIDSDPSRVRAARRVTKTTLPIQNKRLVDVPTTHDRSDHPAEKENDDHIFGATRSQHSAGASIPQQVGEAQGNAIHTGVAHSTTDVRKPGAQELKSSVSLRQPNSNTTASLRSRRQVRHVSTMPSLASRNSGSQTEQRELSSALISNEFAYHDRVFTEGTAARPNSHTDSRFAPGPGSHVGKSVNRLSTAQSSSGNNQISGSYTKQHFNPRDSSKGAPQYAQSTLGLQESANYFIFPSGPKGSIKPQFSTFQQHFSPRKQSKIADEPSVPSGHNNTISLADIHPAVIPLQTELLQLCLLHEACCHTRRRWESDAKFQLQYRFESVVSEYYTVLEAERDARLALSDQALDACCDGSNSDSLEDKVRSLAWVIQELAELSHPEGAHSRIINQFSQYLRRVRDKQDVNKILVDGGQLGSEFLCWNWRDEVALVGRKVGRCVRILDGFGSATSMSSLEEVLACHRKLAIKRLQELEIMTVIEREVVMVEQVQRNNEIDLVLADKDGPRMPWVAEYRAWG